MPKVKVSVIIPTYNRQYIIVKTVESVLDQSKQDLEVIVVDACENRDYITWELKLLKIDSMR
jgi:glycosyltransferase involved in cell wall biosynthesis